MAESSDRLSRGPYRVEIDCPLEFLGPLHIGTGERLSVRTDAPVLRDAAGRAYLPGSSVRGVLRDWCERELGILDFSKIPVAPAPSATGATEDDNTISPPDPRTVGLTRALYRLFGAVPFGKKTTAIDDDRQGRLTVLDVPLDVAGAEVKDHVCIEPKWGAAAHGGKFDQEVVHVRHATVKLVYEGDSSDDPELQLLASAIDALERGILAFGGKSGSGLGWVRCAKSEWRYTDRASDSGFGRFLAERLGASADKRGADSEQPSERPELGYLGKNDRHTNDAAKPWSWLRLKIRLQFDGPMLVAGPPRQHFAKQSRLPDAEYLTHAHAKDAAVLPGSSLRGVLRSEAMRIVSTLGCDSVGSRLFGYVDPRTDMGRRGLMLVGDGCPDGDLERIWMDHVAIDRVTQFAADSKLFNAWALASPAFVHELLLRWHEDDQESQAAAALALLVLRDAQEGLLWAGSRTTRGYGHIEGLTLLSAEWSRLDDDSRTFGEWKPAQAGSVKLADLEAESNVALQGILKDLFSAWRAEAGIEEAA